MNGISYTKNENVFKIIKATANLINIKLKEDFIHFAYCTKANDIKDTKIVARFNNKSTK